MDSLTHTRPALTSLPVRRLAFAPAGSSRVGPLLAGLRGSLRSLILAGAGLPLLATLVLASELGAAAIPTTNSIVIHDAAETLRDWCQRDARGILWLVVPGGARFELVITISDPIVTNRGDGVFHAFDVAEVRAALAAVRYPLVGIAADVFILPYPRRDGLCSAAGPGLILLSPGVFALPREQQHAEFLHELGHLVQYARMPDRAVASWDRYRSLRGIADASVYWAGATHCARPHEIFAEDFRVLFGDPLAASAGEIENPSLAPPSQVTGLDSFMLELPSQALGPALSARPNPARGPVTFTGTGTPPVLLDVFDVAGRRLMTLTPETTSGGVRWVWDGRDEAGRPAGPGVVFARARDSRPASGVPSTVLRVTLLP